MQSGEVGTFGSLLRRYRQTAALSQETLAERAGRSTVAESALERDVRRAPHPGTVDVLGDSGFSRRGTQALLRETLGDAFAVAWAEGRAMRPERAVEESLR